MSVLKRYMKLDENEDIKQLSENDIPKNDQISRYKENNQLTRLKDVIDWQNLQCE